MKKIAIASLIALAAVSASALEVGVTTAREYTGTNTNGTGITLGQKFGKVGVAAGFERFTAGTNDQDRLSLTAGYDIAKIGAITVTSKVGVAHLNNQRGADGYAMTVGVGASMPLTKTVDLTVDARRQYGQDRVQAFDGNTVAAGLRVKF
jgi:outer membrane autotransporter protein